ncbi:hypothetical protein [Nonomuraea typhae]|uniref:Uncharacterized protein n=1 Tax=Nonomuraea typhae TaxID=2603600 RepID=A0ABW7YQU5_9ACTN
MTATIETVKVFRVHGTTDDVTTCGLCERADLKSTVILIELDADGGDLDAHYYGSECGAKAAGWTQSRFRTALSAALAERQREESARQQRLREERSLREATAFASWATTTYGVTVTRRGDTVTNNDVFHALAKLDLTDRLGRRTNFSFFNEFISAVPAENR